jgi:hypothetical protein
MPVNGNNELVIFNFKNACSAWKRVYNSSDGLKAFYKFMNVHRSDAFLYRFIYDDREKWYLENMLNGRTFRGVAGIKDKTFSAHLDIECTIKVG